MAPLEPPDDLQEIQQALQEQQRLIDNLTTVLQELQERTVATDAAAALEQEKMEELRLNMRTMKVMRDQDLHNLGVLSTDVTALQKRLGNTDDQLELHKTEHASAFLRFAEAEGASVEKLRRIELLEAQITAVTARLSTTDEHASTEATMLRQIGEVVASLQQEAEKASIQRQEITAAHAETASSLSDLLASRLPLMVAQAESGQHRLENCTAGIQSLEMANGSLRARVADLEAVAEVASKERLATSSAAHDLDAQLRLHKGETAQQAAAAKATWEQLQDACDQIEHLKRGAEDTGGQMKQVKLEVGEVRKEGQQRSGQLAALSEALASLRKEIRVADEEVAAVHAYLGFPPRLTASSASSKTAN
mmetsp:Transcript_42454/g.76277  ORF Transcript_42454/g.76277 Transcript_42454/m.76277 type:complete len:365 (-) Transcript_42454:186-1280(-)